MLAWRRFYWHPKRPKTSADVFQVEQKLWGVLAGDRDSYWRRRAVESQESTTEELVLYAPLDGKRREIRLLEVSCLAQSDANERAFVARLVQVALDDNPTYLAITYAWGEPSAAGYFRDSNGVQTPLGYNKATFEILSTLVAPGCKLHLWIDSICINQEDHDERASQVAIMGDIYRQAQQVVVFLGMADDATTRAMDLLQLTQGFIQANGDFLRPMSIDDFENLSRGAGLPPTSWVDVAHLISRLWFTRAWVVQEVAVSSDVLVVCGHHAVTWKELCQLCGWIVDNNGILFEVMDHHAAASQMSHRDAPFRNALSIAAARSLQCTEKNPTILQQLLLSFRVFRASDPRDKIYSLLALALPTDRDEPDFHPNYRIGVEDLYTQVTRRILLRDAEILILSAAGVGHRRSLLLPSWVPDWTSPTEGTTLDEIAAAGNYRATEQGTRPIVSYDSQIPGMIALKGCVVDTIAKMSSECLGQGREGRLRYVQDIIAWIEEVLDMAGLADLTSSDQPNDSEGREAQKTALWKTLTASGSTAPQNDSRRRSQQPGGRRPPTERGFDTWLAERRECAAKSSLEGFNLDRAAREEVTGFAYHFARATRGRRFFVSSEGHLGLAAAGAEVGDAVCVFRGIRTPFAIRESGTRGVGGGDNGSSADMDYVLVGEVYHYGIVSGALGLYPPSGPIKLV